MKKRFGILLRSFFTKSFVLYLVIASVIISSKSNCYGGQEQFVSLPIVVPFIDAEYWVLKEPLVYLIPNTVSEITVPQGFVTDFASIPRALWVVLPSTGRYLASAILHDYLYWNQTCTQEQADKIMDIAMEEAKVNSLKRKAIYRGIRNFGKFAWSSNMKKKARGELRFIPAEYQNIPVDTTWGDYERELRSKGIKNPEDFDLQNVCKEVATP